jgi:hypothetical protein
MAASQLPSIPIPDFSAIPAGVPLPPNTTTTTNPSSSSQGAPNPSIKTLSEIKSKLLSPALTSHYQCWFNPPKKVRDWIETFRGFDYDFVENSELISLSCSEASLPGSSLMTNEINDDHTGMTERHAYRRQYDDRADFTFYVDYGADTGNYNVLWFFESWIAYIMNESNVDPSNNYFYRTNWPVNYQSPALYINKFERDYKGKFLQYRFLKAYPISISSMPVSYDSSQLLKCTVSFTYTRYIINRF